MIIDGHAHVTAAGYGSPALLKQRMQECGIDRVVLVPGGMLDVRRMSTYVSGGARAETPHIPNDIVEALIREDPTRYHGFFCVNPHEGEAAVSAFRAAIARGFSGLKLAPIVHRFALDCETVKQLAESCGELGVPFYSHAIAEPSASTSRIGLLAAEFPRTTFILGHMGVGPADPEAVEIAARHENVFLETSGGAFLGIQAALTRLGASKLIYGSEFPLHHQSVELHKLHLLARDRELELMAGANLAALLRPHVLA